MNIISKTNRTPTQYHKCELCGDLITSDEYTHIEYQTQNDSETLICHSQCSILANRLGLMNGGSISMYTFTKRVKDYIYNLQSTAKKRVNKKTIDSYPIKELIRRLNSYHNDLECSSKSKKERTEETMRAEISLFIMMLMMPTIFDNVATELSNAGRYPHKVKYTLSKCLMEFEDISVRLAKLYAGTKELDNMSFGALDTLEAIEQSINIEGVDKWCNILMACIAEMFVKCNKINTEIDTHSHTQELKVIERKLNSVLKYNNYNFINIIIAEKCSGNEILFTK